MNDTCDSNPFCGKDTAVIVFVITTAIQSMCQIIYTETSQRYRCFVFSSETYIYSVSVSSFYYRCHS